MISVRGRFWTVIGFLMLFSVGTWSLAATGLGSATTPEVKGRQGLACATIATDPGKRSRLPEPVVRNCAPPPTSHDGFRPIEWVLYPDEPLPTSASRSIVVAVHEGGCAGGRNPIPYLQRPEVRYLGKAVVITLWIEVLEGIHSCPSNPIGRLRVKLPGPLGTRQLYDGATDPPRKVEPGEDPRRLPWR